MRVLHALFAGVCTLILLLPADVHAHEQLQIGDSALRDTLQRQGYGKLRVWGFRVYTASTWRPGQSGDQSSNATGTESDTDRREQFERPFALQIQYQRAFLADDLVETTRDEWQRMKLWKPEQEQWLQRCRTIWPDVRDGDVLTLLIDREGRSVFFFNGQSRGRIDDIHFGPQFVAIWIGEQARFADLREQLLGASLPGARLLREFRLRETPFQESPRGNSRNRERQAGDPSLAQLQPGEQS